MEAKFTMASQNLLKNDYSHHWNCWWSQAQIVNLGRRNSRGETGLFSSISPAISSILKLSTKLKCKPISAVSKIVYDQEAFSTKAKAKIVTIVGDGSASPFKNVPWEDVMTHMAAKLKWIDEGYELLVITDSILGKEEKKFKLVLAQTDILVIVGVQNHDSIKWVSENTEMIPTILSFDCLPALKNKLGGLEVSSSYTSMIDKLLVSVQGKKMKESLEVLKIVQEAWDRQNSDDIRFLLIVLINSYVRPVPILQNLRAKGLSTLYCMVKNCGPKIIDCLLDPNCRKAIVCLNKCAPTDQVCSYRCLASFESPKLEAFSLCVLQKHNCLGLNAEILLNPNVQPLSYFRGRPLSHEVAEDLFVGWLGEFESSWRVAAGQNPAYDYFPCQYQLFYRGKAKGTFWYEPVFQVKTLDGKMVWRRRRYRVRRGTIPGTFIFTVLDNGVISREFWRIVDVTDDLSWGLFYYSGAAKAAGQSYTGAVLVTPDGSWPSKIWAQRLSSALEKCGIKDWEMYGVDNSCCTNAPLGLPEGSSLHLALKVRDSKIESLSE